MRNKYKILILGLLISCFCTLFSGCNSNVVGAGFQNYTANQEDKNNVHQGFIKCGYLASKKSLSVETVDIEYYFGCTEECLNYKTDRLEGPQKHDGKYYYPYKIAFVFGEDLWCQMWEQDKYADYRKIPNTSFIMEIDYDEFLGEKYRVKEGSRGWLTLESLEYSYHQSIRVDSSLFEKERGLIAFNCLIVNKETDSEGEIVIENSYWVQPMAVTAFYYLKTGNNYDKVKITNRANKNS